ncbi:MAG: hypothetical protein IJ983_04475 [Kiritimatiellae bacterium]|nr:hypothetical protein [Kiritimatiellia bacterium]MBR2940413.1 hypothetical protein [Kiritimatiellia bacterium]
MEVDGISLTMGGAAVSAIAGVVGAWVKAKYGKTTVPQPLETREEPQYVTCDQCRQHRDAIQKRIDDIGPALGRVFKKLDENDKKAEKRTQDTHRRLDPFIEEFGAVRGKVELIEKAAMNATMGGTKQ